MLDDCYLNSYTLNFINSYGLKFFVDAFLPYKIKLGAENYKLWLYYLTILNKISTLIKPNKQQYIDKFCLSNGEICILISEIVDIFIIFDENKCFTIMKNNAKFLETQICLQIQLQLLEILKNLFKNKEILKNVFINGIYSENMIIIMKRIMFLLFFNKTKLKNECTALFSSIVSSCFFILYSLIKDKEILTKFFK